MAQPPPRDATPRGRGRAEGRTGESSVGDTLSLNTRTAPDAKASQKEADADYAGEIARLSDRWRVIVCRDRIQWILQSRDAGGSHMARWRGRHYCTTREALIRLCGSLCAVPDVEAMLVLSSLPERIRRGER